MHITWYGQSCFKLQNSKQIVLLDPYSGSKHGLRSPVLKATIMLFTDPEDKKIIQKKTKQKSFFISSPGEYELKNIFIYGIPFVKKDNKNTMIYQLEIDHIKFGVLGEIDSLLSDEDLDKLDGVDVLFVPAGGKDMIGFNKATEIINSIEPKIVIPCCFKIPKLKTDLQSVDKFLKEVGVKDVQKVDRLTLHKKSLSQESLTIIVLEPKV